MSSRYRLAQWIIAGTFGVIGVAGLVVGILIGHGRVSSLLLIAFGAASLFAAVYLSVLTLAIRRRAEATVRPAERAGLLEYVRVSRLVRAVVELVSGTAVLIVGIVIIVGGSTIGFVLVGTGVLLVLFGVMNVWLVRRVTAVAAAAESAPAGD